MGSGACQSNRVVPPWVVVPARNPLATTPRPCGTVTWKSYAALSLGWSLTGNQPAATSGCPATVAPSSVAMKPVRRVKSPNGSRNSFGTPE